MPLHCAAVSALLATFASEIEALVRRLAVEAVEAALGPAVAPRPAAPAVAPKRRRRRARAASKAPKAPKAKTAASAPATPTAPTAGPVPPHKRQPRTK